MALHDYIPGEANKMADICSRAWHLSDTELLAYFDLHFPQDEPWTLCHLRKPMRSSLISALYGKRSEPASHLNVPQPMTTIGNVGTHFASTTTSTPSYATLLIQSQSSSSSDSDTETAAWPPAITASDLEQWRTPSVLWDRSSPVWGPKTFAKTAMGP